MAVSSRFTIALHIFACIDAFGDTQKVTSNFLASSINANPVTVRQIIGQLKAKGLVSTSRGHSGAYFGKLPEAISLLEVLQAVEGLTKGQVFSYHVNPNLSCPVGGNIHDVLDNQLSGIQAVFEEQLAQATVADVLNDLRQRR